MSRAEVEEWLLRYCRLELGVREEDLSLTSDYASVGLDSTDMAGLVAELEGALDRSLPRERLVGCRSLAALAGIAAGLVGRPPPTEVADDLSSDFERFLNPHLGEQLRCLNLDKRFVRGEGSHLYDDNGSRYLDFTSQYGALPFGHNPQEIWSAIQLVQTRGEPSFVQPSQPVAASELAKRLIALAPGGMRYVTFANSGAEAVEVAIKACIAATGRRGILSTHRSFHGKTLGTLSATGNPTYQRPFHMPLEGYAHIPYGDLPALEEELRARGQHYAAFIVEPVQGEGGVIEPPKGYLGGVSELCHAAGVRVISDEVQTGLGRTGQLFASETEGFAPDVITLAKALGGGLIPVGACLVNADTYSKSLALKHSSTFAGGTLAMRVGLATLEVLTRDDSALLAQVRTHSTFLKDGLCKLKERYPNLIAGVRGRGFMLGLELSRDVESWPNSYLAVAAAQQQLAHLLAAYLLNVEHVRVAPTLNGTRVLRVQPPLTASRQECEAFLDAMQRTLETFDSRNSTDVFRGILTGEAPPCASLRSTKYQRASAPLATVGSVRFGFVLHPLDRHSFANFDPTLAQLSDGQITKFEYAAGALLDPFVFSSAIVHSSTGQSVVGEFVAVPLTAEAMMEMPRSQSVAAVRAAVALARRGGAQVVGLGGYTSVVTQGGQGIMEDGVAITNGNSYTVVAGHATILEHANRLSKPLHRSAVAVVGAAGSIGTAISCLLAGDVARIVLVGNPARSAQASRTQLREVARAIINSVIARPASVPAAGTLASLIFHRHINQPGSSINDTIDWLEHDQGCLVLSNFAAAVLPLADVIVTATSSPASFISSSHIRSGALICELSRPSNFEAALRKERPDLHFLEGGLIRLPRSPTVGPLGLPTGVVYACMAETILLALEGRFDLCSRGAVLQLEVVRDMQRMSEQHGFVIGSPSHD